MQAINRQVAHYAYRVGQIVYLAKHFVAAKTGKWKALSVPRGKSKEFMINEAIGRKTESGRAPLK